MWYVSDWVTTSSEGFDFAIGTEIQAGSTVGRLSVQHLDRCDPRGGSTGPVHRLFYAGVGGGFSVVPRFWQQITDALPIPNIFSAAISTAEFPSQGAPIFVNDRRPRSGVAGALPVDPATTTFDLRRRDPPRLRLRDLEGWCQIFTVGAASGPAANVTMICFQLDTLYVAPEFAINNCRAVGILGSLAFGGTMIGGGGGGMLYRGQISASSGTP